MISIALLIVSSSIFFKISSYPDDDEGISSVASERVSILPISDLPEEISFIEEASSLTSITMYFSVRSGTVKYSLSPDIQYFTVRYSSLPAPSEAVPEPFSAEVSA